MTDAVHQFVPSLAPRDAIGSHTLAVQELLWEMGLRSEIFADEVKPGLAGRAHPYRSYDRWWSPRRVRGGRRGRTWLLYQSSIGSPVADFLAGRDDPLLIYFHNITPRRLVEAWDPDVGRASATGWAQLARLAPRARAGLAASAYNRSELVEAGARRTVVAPPLLAPDAFDAGVDEGTLGRLAGSRAGAELVFVGRLSPHKGQHHLIAALAAYRRAYDPGARLHLVGGSASASYQAALAAYAAELGLEHAVDLAGSVTPAQLSAHYVNADAFVCASGHEGFCVPLLEAMHHRLPIVAYGAGAVPETVGQAGLVLGTRAPTTMAAALHRVLIDQGLRTALTAAGEARLADLGPARSRPRLAAAIQAALD